MTKLQPRMTRPQGLEEEPQEIAAPPPRRREFNDMRFQVVDQATQLDFVDTTRQPVFEVLKGIEAEQSSPGGLTAADLEAARDTPLYGLLLEAIENMSVGFILFDHDDRLVLCNNRYRDFYAPIAHLLEPGKSYDEIADTVLDFAARAPEPVRTDGWVRGGRPAAERTGLAAGRWLESRGQELDGGGHLALHSDVTRQKQREIELADEVRTLQADRDQAAGLVADLELSLSLLRGGAERLRQEAGGRNGLSALADDLRIAVQRGDEVLLDLAEVTADDPNRFARSTSTTSSSACSRCSRAPPDGTSMPSCASITGSTTSSSMSTPSLV